MLSLFHIQRMSAAAGAAEEEEKPVHSWEKLVYICINLVIIFFIIVFFYFFLTGLPVFVS